MTEAVNLTRSDIDLDRLVAVTERFLEEYGLKDREVSLAVVGDKRMEALNGKYRKKMKTTDVLSFEGEGLMLGEVILNFQQIKRQALKFCVTPEQEMIFILVHGLLHLIGRIDETEEQRQDMIGEARKFILKLNQKDDKTK